MHVPPADDVAKVPLNAPCTAGVVLGCVKPVADAWMVTVSAVSSLIFVVQVPAAPVVHDELPGDT